MNGESERDWWTDGRPGLEQGLLLYTRHTSPKVETAFQELSARLQNRDPPFLDASDMLVLARFKGRGAYAVRKAVDIETVTQRALTLAREERIHESLVLLCAVPGIRVPVASALLTAAMPRDFGVIDRLTMSEVSRLLVERTARGPLADDALVGLGWGLWEWVRDPDFAGQAKAYEYFVQGLRKRAAVLGCSAREIEKALFAFGRLNRTAGPAIASP